MKQALLALLVLVSSFAVAETDPKLIYQMVKKNEAVVIDIREKDETKTGMIENAEWFPKSRMDSEENWQSDFKKLVGAKKIYLYCRTGRRATMVQEKLKAMNLESVNMGGYEDLKKVLPYKEPQK